MSGVKVTVLFALMVRVPLPLVRPVTCVTESGNPLGSLSLASTAIVTGVWNGVAALSFCATGGGDATTETVTFALAVPPWPLEITYENRSPPEYVGVGV